MRTAVIATALCSLLACSDKSAPPASSQQRPEEEPEPEPEREKLAGIYYGQPAKEVLELLGQPKRVGDPGSLSVCEQESLGVALDVEFENGVTVELIRGRRSAGDPPVPLETGRVGRVVVSGNSTIATADGIALGSTREQVMRAYGDRLRDEARCDPYKAPQFRIVGTPFEQRGELETSNLVLSFDEAGKLVKIALVDE